MICDYCEEFLETVPTPAGWICLICMEEPYIQSLLKDCEDHDNGNDESSDLSTLKFLQKQAD